MSNKKMTSAKMAHIAALALRNPNSSKLIKRLAASALSQARGKKKK